MTTEKNGFVVVRDKRHARFLIGRGDGKVSLAGFENDQIPERLVEVLGVIINLAEALDDVATIKTAFRVENFGVGNELVFAGLSGNQIWPPRLGLRLNVKLDALVMQIFIKIVGERLPLTRVCIARGTQGVTAEPLAAVFIFF